jgi:hypothetical protein
MSFAPVQELPSAPQAILELSEITSELKRLQYQDEPQTWVKERLGEFLWTAQIEIMKAVRDNRHVAVRSCFDSGKSWTAARIACWWIDTHPPGQAFVVTTARSGVQVKAILWHEIHRAHGAGKLPGRLNQTEWWRDVRNSDGEGSHEEIVAFGRKPGDKDPTAFQGTHRRFVLVILDEAAEIPAMLFEAADALATNDESRVLAIGNPTDGSSHFAKVSKPGSGWKAIRISAWDTPNFTDEKVPEDIKAHLLSRVWVEEKRSNWGETNPMWVAKVEAEFPETREDALIPYAWVRDAIERNLPEGIPVELGVDVGAGGDRNVIACRKGSKVRLIRRDYQPDTMQTCGNLVKAIQVTGATACKVDSIGIGKGAVDRARELRFGEKQARLPVVGVNVGEKARDPEEFLNLRAEGYWGLRERFEAGDVDLPTYKDMGGEDLAAQLVDVRFKRTSRGQVQIESKDDIKRRSNGASPDDADAVMLAFMKAPEMPKVKRLKLREF